MNGASEAPPIDPPARSRAQAKQWKQERKQQAKEKAQAPSVPSAKPNRPPRDASPEVQLSKALSYLLRHGAEKEFLSIRPDGFVRLDAVLARPKVQKIAMPCEGGPRAPTTEDVEAVVHASDKQRFALVRGTADAPDTPGDVAWIRAVQGHSLARVTDLGNLPLTPANVHEHLAEEGGVRYAIHGTDDAAWDRICASHALKRMGRNEIHLARGLPGEAGVISGMRRSCTRLLYVDVGAALADGIAVSLSSNKVVLTRGIDGELPLRYVYAVRNERGVQVWP